MIDVKNHVWGPTLTLHTFKRGLPEEFQILLVGDGFTVMRAFFAFDAVEQGVQIMRRPTPFRPRFKNFAKLFQRILLGEKPCLEFRRRREHRY